MESKEIIKKKVLMFTATSHPLLEDIQAELEDHYEKVILYRFPRNKPLLKQIVKNTPFFIRHIKEVIQFIRFFFENYKFFKFVTVRWYLILLHLLYLDKKNNFSIIDCHWVYPAGLIATFYANYFSKHVVITAHGYDARKEDLQKKPKLIPLILKTISNADYVLTAERKLFENLKTLGVKKITFTNQFVDLNKFEEAFAVARSKLSIKEDSFVIGFGPHLKEEYGIKDFIEAIILVKKGIPNLYVICLGGGDLLDYVKTKFNENTIRFLIPGRISHQEFINHIKACDIVCIPGYVTQGIFALEAFACAKATIGYLNIHEIKIEHDKTGKLVDKGNIDELAQNILKLYKDPNLCNQLGQNARNIIETNYQKQKRINDILRAFRNKNEVL